MITLGPKLVSTKVTQSPELVGSINVWCLSGVGEPDEGGREVAELYEQNGAEQAHGPCPSRKK